MLFVFPNLDVYSSLGSYTIESQGLRANSLSEFSNEPPKIRKNWAAIGWAFALGAAAAGADAYNYAKNAVTDAYHYQGHCPDYAEGGWRGYHIGRTESGKKPSDYDKTDFFKFDN